MVISKIQGCIACGTCMQTCPTDVIRLDSATGKAVITYPNDCQICCLCVAYCPADAITVTYDKSNPVVISWG